MGDLSEPDTRSTNPLSHRAYRRLFAAQVTSLVGTGLTTVALALLAHDMAGGTAGAVLGSVLAMKMLVYVFVAPALGAVAHRLPRKGLLIGLDVLRALIVLALPWVDQLWQIYALVVVLSVASAGFTPAFQATIPDVLPDQDTYTRALSLSRLAYDLENLASPSLAALALAYVSYTRLFLFDSATFVLSAVLVGMTAVGSPSQPLARTSDGWGALLYGLRTYLRTPRLRGLLALHFAGAAAGAMVIVNTVVYVRDRLALGESETAWCMAAAGGGSMLTALVLPKLLDRLANERRIMLLGAGCAASALIAGALLPSSLLSLSVAWFAVGIGTSAIQTPAGRLVRRSCHAEDRPAVFAAEFGLSHAAWLVAYPTAGLVGTFAGLDAAFVALAAIAGLGIVVAGHVWPPGEEPALEHEHEAVTHAHPHVHDEHHDHDHEGWEGPEPHDHPHEHRPLKHRHEFVIDTHHGRWPRHLHG